MTLSPQNRALSRARSGYLVAILVAGLFSQTSLAQSQYDIPRTKSKPAINGEIDEQEWDDALSISITVETEPGENVPAEVVTEGLVMEDGESLYVAFIAEDPRPEQIRAFYRDRDQLWDDDWVAIILDTFNDERRAFEFYVNPLGVQADDIFDDVNQRKDEAWDAIWDSAGQITDSGYLVEMAIPLNQLRFS